MEGSDSQLDQLQPHLGHELDSLLGSLGSLSLDEMAFRNWNRWLETSSGPRADEFMSRLSLAQLNSHRILWELWNGHSDRDFLLAMASFFKDQAANAAEDETLEGSESSPDLPRLATGTNFQKVIFNLFVWEFFCTTDMDRSQTFLSLLHGSRREAALYMASARLSRRCLAEIQANSEDLVVVGGPSSWKRGSAAVGASIQPCPWLRDKPPAVSMPHYLWDRQLRRTVVVGDLEERPEYIAVSHTWGRWKTEDPPVHLPCTPWPIPLNTRFVVPDLPDTLQKILLPQRYVWMDLLCIPQDGSVLSKVEISRQATIFREASVAVMWLNDIDEWTSLPAVLEWLCFQFIVDNDLSAGEADAASAQKQQKLSSQNIELVTPSTNTSSATIPGELHPWFTSLWTLQEICLRPDMLLANKSWEFVKLRGTPVTFDEVVALEYTARKTENTVQMPAGVLQLSSLLLRCGLSQLASMTRPTVLGLGSHRHCLERRAEAVMAVLDATEWFDAYGTDEERERDLVLGQYPLAFVHELQRKLVSATFFNTDTVQPFFTEVLEQMREHPEGTVFPVGSMLPFGPGQPKHYQEVTWDSGMLPHETTTTWVVESTGCVCIPQAVVVSSAALASAEDRQELPSAIFAPNTGPLASPYVQQMDLHEWVKMTRPEFANYALCLFASPLGSTGILLKELSLGLLVKVGTYFQSITHGNRLPRPSQLDWLVL